MLFPDAAKKAIASAFYDKEVAILDKSVSVDAEGGAVKTGGAVKSTFTANVQFTRLEEIQTELGLTERIDVAITCPCETAVAVDDLLQYQYVIYTVKAAPPRDSHRLIVGQKWQT
jgi:hypothetical protein